MKKRLLLFVLLIHLLGYGQNLTEVDRKLEELSKTEKGLNGLVQVNVSNISMYDFITALGVEHQLSVSVDPTLNQPLINNFYNVPVKDVLSFLIKKYDLEVDFLGKILSLKKKKAERPKVQKKSIDVVYEKGSDYLSLNLQRDTLFQVVREITKVSGKNVILSPSVSTKIVSGYIVNQPFKQTLEMLSRSNGLSVAQDKNDYFYIDQLKKTNQETSIGLKLPVATSRLNRTPDNLLITSGLGNTLSITADEVPVIDIILNAAKKQGVNYFMYSLVDPNTKTSFLGKDLSFEQILEHVLKGSRYTYKKEQGYYLIGEKNVEGLRSTQLIQLQNRTIQGVLNSIPSKIITELEIKEFPELNGLLASGHESAIKELQSFVESIDKHVPVVQIEVIIFQQEKGYDMQTGFKAGLDNTQDASLVSAFPTTDVKLNSRHVNKLINAFNNLGIMNLGQVPVNFFMSLKLLENNSIIKLESTPKIATLNGHEATLKIGATDYYFEQTNQLINGNINRDILQTGQWKPTEANLSLRIQPFVSKDENVTLNITVEKSSFTGRAGENAPPGKSTQQFDSMIRVKNGDMILLGGLDEIEKNNSGTGTPFFSRIPIIKWFFSSRKKKKSKKKLHMLIKPTVYY